MSLIHPIISLHHLIQPQNTQYKISETEKAGKDAVR